MKKIFFYVLFLCALNTQLFAQAPPQAFNYQAIARDASGNPIPDRQVTIRVTILEDNSSSSPLYVEIHSALTNRFGLFNLQIGRGTPTTGNFTQLAWGVGNKFMLIEFDPDGGTNWNNMGVTQLLSVPFALYAGSAQNGGVTGPMGPTGPQGVPGTSGSPDSAVVATNVSDGYIALTSSLLCYAGGAVTIVAPAAGAIFVQATVWVRMDHSNGTDDKLNLVIGTSPTDPGDSYHNVNWTIPASFPSFPLADYTFSLIRTFVVPSAGTYTYYINGSMPSGASGNDTFWSSAMQAVYH